MAGIALPQVVTEDRASGAQFIDGSLVFNADLNQYLSKTPSSEGNRRTWTWSGWVKRDEINTEDGLFVCSDSNGNSDYTTLYFNTQNELKTVSYQGGAVRYRLTTNAVYRGTGWLHVVLAVNLMESTNSDKVKLYVNGSQITSFRQSDYPSTNFKTRVNSTNKHSIGSAFPYNTWYSDFKMTQVHFLDGIAAGPEEFGYTDALTGVWRPKKYKGEFNGPATGSGTEYSTTSTMANAATVFDGDATSYASQAMNSGSYQTITTAPITFTSGSFTYNTNNGGATGGSNYRYLRLTRQSDGATTELQVNDTNGWTIPSDYRNTTISKMEWKRWTSYENVSAVYVDGAILQDAIINPAGVNGFYLPMDGNSPIGKEQTPSPNDGTVWSASLTSTQAFNLGTPRAFDGDTSTLAATANASNANILFTKTFNNVTKLRIYMDHDYTAYRVRVNGGSWHVDDTLGATQNSGWRDLTSLIPNDGIITSIESDTGGQNNGVNWSAVEVNGVILVDNQVGVNWNSVYIAGSAGLDKSTGAKPILNTTNGGNVAAPGPFGSKENKDYTILGTSGGGLYRFEGISGTNPPFSFVRGATYIFDYTAATSHPLAFSTTDPDSSVTSYTDGVNTATSNVTKITVPHDAPDTLYYYCTSHNNMNNAITVTTDETKADPYAWKCVFASGLIDNATDVSNQINVNSAAKATTISGASIDYTESNFYGTSYQFDGSNDYIKTNANSEDFNFRDGDFTIECWFNTDGGASKCLVSLWNYVAGRRSWNVYITGSNNITLITSDDGSGNQTDRATISSGYYRSGMWNHVAFVRTGGNTYKGFINGQLAGVSDGSNTLYVNTNDTIYIGCTNGVTEFYDGHIQDVRIYKGVAKYTDNFIPASPDPDIIPTTPSGVIYKSKLPEITQGSVEFDGVSDSLEFPTSSDLNLTGDFTMEFFIYNRALAADTADPGILTLPTDGSNETQIYVRLHDVSYTLYKGGIILSSSAGAPVLNQWQHVAFTRSGQSIRVFVDGKLQNTVSNTSTFGGTTGTFRIGSYSGSTGDTNCSISNVRILKGTALYTADFTPPSAPLTAITNTKLLCCQSPDSATAAAVTPGTLSTGWMPAGYTYWDAGYNAGWHIAGAGDKRTSTATTSDYITSALPSTGKHYWEIKVNSVGTYHVFGVTDQGGAAPGADGYEDNISGFYYNNNPPIFLSKKSGGASTVDQAGHGAGSGTTFVNGDVLMWAYDAAAAKMWVGRNGTWYFSGDPAAGTNACFQNMPTSNAYYKLAYATTGGGNMTFEILNKPSGPVPTNFNPFNDDIDTVRGQETGYCTWNPVTKKRGTLTDGNLLFYGNGTNTPRINGTISASSGKWYYESTVLNDGPGTGSGDVHNSIGWGLDRIALIDSAPNTSGMDHSFYFMDSGYYKNFDGSNTSTGTGKWLAGDVIGVAADLDNHILTFYKNNIEVLSQYINTSEGTPLCPVHQSNTGNYGRSITNFGQKPFNLSPPDGFQPLTLSNTLSDTVTTRPDKYFTPKAYTGNGGTQQIDYGFQPDLIFGKARSATSGGGWIWTDSVRGSDKYLDSINTNQQGTFTGSNGVTFNATGTSITDNASGDWNLNGSAGGTYAGSTGGYIYYGFKGGGNAGTFNIDGVDMGSAAGAKMSVGALNSTTYNETQNWSAGGGSGLYGSSTWAPTFDGSPALTGSDVTQSAYVTNNGASTVTFNAISGVLELRACQGSNTPSTGANRPYILLSDGQVIRVDGANNRPSNHTVNVTNITSITIKGNSAQGMNLLSVKLDGKLLVDTSATPPDAPSTAVTACSVNTKQKFGIYTFDGNSANRTLAHGLGQKPDFMICKKKSTNGNSWVIWHKSLEEYHYLMFPSSNGQDIDATLFNSHMSDGNNLWTVGSNTTFNETGQSTVAYLWCDVPGVQKFGIVESIGDAGYCHLGFKPAFVITKNIDANADWALRDNQRADFNPNQTLLRLNVNSQESTSTGEIDFLAEGFRIRGSGFGSYTYAYAAWAEEPSTNLFGGQSIGK